MELGCKMNASSLTNSCHVHLGVLHLELLQASLKHECVHASKELVLWLILLR